MLEENEKLKFVNSIDDLPDLLLVEIIQRLPLNSIFRSKYVSKKWLYLISDPLFVHSYTSRQKSLTRPLALFYISFLPTSEQPCIIGPFCPFFESDSMIFPLNFFASKLQQRQKEKNILQLIGSDSDLLLFSGTNDESRDIYCVCNPLTSEWFTLPKFHMPEARYAAVGFMVEEGGTFWVVEILQPWSDSSSQVFLKVLVFCSGTGKWYVKKVTSPRLFHSFWAKTTVVYQGMIIWMVDGGFLAFDPKNNRDKCHAIDMPSSEVGKFGVSCGLLHYYEVSSYDPSELIENPILRVWILINFEAGEWVLKHSIRYGNFWSSDECLSQHLLLPNMMRYFQWVSFHPLNSDMVFLKCDGKLVSCKISSACLKGIPCDHKEGIFYRLEWDVLPLVFRPWPTTVSKTSRKISIASNPRYAYSYHSCSKKVND